MLDRITSWKETYRLSDDYSHGSGYSRRGRYGNPTQRCAWCGKPTSWIQRSYWGGSFERHYCSFSCRAAGDFYITTAIAIAIPVVAVFIFLMIMNTILIVIFEDVLVLVIFIIIPDLCFWAQSYVGWRERQYERIEKW
jgi:hypothetical protein